jgi:protein TonB
MVRAVVGPNGKPGSVAIHRSSGYAVLDQAALLAVRGWKFIPRRVNGEAVNGTVEVPVNFSLNR